MMNQKTFRNLFLVTALCLILSLLIPTSPRSTHAQEDSFIESFDNPELPGWEHSPNAKVQEGILRIEGDGFAFHPMNLYNAEIILRLRLEGDGDLEVQFRSTDSSSYSFLYTNERFVLLRFKDGTESELKSIPREFHHNEWVHIRIHTSEGEQLLNVADEAELSALDTSPLPPGGFMLRVRGEAIGEFDDIQIINLEAAPSPSDESPPPSSDEIPSTAEGNPAYQSVPWIYTGGPSGGLGYDIRMVPGNPDIMFVTDANAGVFKSMDGGRTWTPKNNGILTRLGPAGDHVPVFSLTIDPNDPDRIWIGTQYSSGIYRSDDSGENWTLMNNGVKETAISVRGFTVEPGNSDIVYMAGEVSSWEWNGSPLPGLGVDMTKGVVYKTVDGGENWQRIWFGDNLARYIWIHPDNHNLIYVSTGIFDREAANSNPEVHEIGGVGVLRSRDGGKTWDILNEDNGFAHEDLYIGSIFMHPENPSILIAAAGNDPYGPAGGIYLTEDGGDHWIETLDSHNMSIVEICESDPDVVYAGSLGAFFRSMDGGKTWDNLTPEVGMWGPADVPAGFPIDAQCDPRDPMRIFVNNYVGGSFLSQDGGETWVNSSAGYTGAMMNQIAIVKDDPAQLYATARSGVFATRDGGNTWSGLSYGAARTLEGIVISVDPQNPNHIFTVLQDAGPDPKVSWDGGKTWDVVMTGRWQPGEFSPDTITSIHFSHSDSNVVLATIGPYECWLNTKCDQVFGRGIIRSQDGGQSWSLTNLEEGNVSALVSSSDSIWYAAVHRGGLFRSNDDGQTWELINPDPLPPGFRANNPNPEQSVAAGIISLACHPEDPEWLYAGILYGGFAFSQDGGETWQASSAGLPPETMIADLAIDPIHPQMIYAALRESGVYLSKDGGQTWASLNQGLTNRAAEHLSISADGSVLYLGTEGAGVFRLGNPPAASLPTAIPTQAAIEESSPQIETTAPEIVQSSEPEEESEGNPLLPKCLQSPMAILVVGLFAFSQWYKKHQGAK